MITFNWNGITFSVKKDQNGTIVYRDASHLGGSWSNAAKTITNTSLKISFRRALKNAVTKLE